MSDKKNKQFIKKPYYKGGTTAFNKFISDNLKYPKEALKNKIEGTVMIKYSIDYKGKVSDVKLIKSLGYGCDEEAVRLIKLLEFEVPKEPRKLRVLFHKETKMFFKLPKKKPAENTVSYSISTTASTKDASDDSSENSSYSYIIKW